MPKFYAIVDKETGEIARDEFRRGFLFSHKVDARQEMKRWISPQFYEVIPVSIVPYKIKKKYGKN